MPQKPPLPDLKSLKKVHIIGVCGTLMGAFAAFLKRSGLQVTGSDQNIYPPMSDVLKNAGVELFNGYRAENLSQMSPRPDLVVIGNVIGASNPEAQYALAQGLAYTSLPEAMEVLMLGETRNLVVAGTHGKTTTSSLLAHTLAQCGKNPSYFIGGVSLDLPFSFQVTQLKKGSYFVLEGDEYDTAFWDKVPKFNHYLPDDVILTSVEFDHADIYADLEAVKKAFQGLLTRIRPQGRLIACTDFPEVRQLIERHAPQGIDLITYGASSDQGARITAAGFRSETTGISFDVLDGGRKVSELKLQVPGQHNMLNALAVWIECREIGIPDAEISRALSSFRGVKRRQEERGEVGGVLVIDDFAHHPTAVRETLRALKAKYRGRRLVSVFEPRSATSRRKVFQKEYAAAFAEADSVFIATPYDQSKIAQDNLFSSDQLVDDLKRASKSAQSMATVDQGVVRVAEESRTGDVIAVLSNGGFDGFIPKLLEALSKKDR